MQSPIQLKKQDNRMSSKSGDRKQQGREVEQNLKNGGRQYKYKGYL